MSLGYDDPNGVERLFFLISRGFLTKAFWLLNFFLLFLAEGVCPKIGRGPPSPDHISFPMAALHPPREHAAMAPSSAETALSELDANLTGP